MLFSRRFTLCIISSFLTMALTVGLNSNLANAEEFPISSKGWQAAVTSIEGVNTSTAMAIGEVKRGNAAEYCERDPGSITRKHGGKLTKTKCIEQVLRDEKGKSYSAFADCPKKTIMSDNRSYTLIGTEPGAFPEFKWRDNQSGKILDGSNASGAPIIEGQFRLLCPNFILGR